MTDSDEEAKPVNWQITPCPYCKGKGEYYVNYEEEYHSGYEKCSTCNGKKFVKIALDRYLDSLEEYRPR